MLLLESVKKLGGRAAARLDWASPLLPGSSDLWSFGQGSEVPERASDLSRQPPFSFRPSSLDVSHMH